MPWIDAFASHIRHRFLKHNSLLKKLSCLLPSDSKQINNCMDEFLNLAKYYEADLEDTSSFALQAEFKLWNEAIKKCIGEMPKNAIDALNRCNEHLYPNVFALLKIFATLPVSTSSAERSFSTLKRIKSYLRNTMGENRLNGLANLNIHREIDVSPEEVISVLNEGPRRINFVL